MEKIYISAFFERKDMVKKECDKDIVCFESETDPKTNAGETVDICFDWKTNSIEINCVGVKINAPLRILNITNTVS